MDNRRKSSAGRPRKACSTCKTQKIRCTEERPSCKRCVRLHHVCTYSGDPPPERNNRSSPQDVAQRDVASKHAQIPRMEQRAAQAHAAQFVHRRLPILPQPLPQPGGTMGAKPYLGVLESLVPELVDIYFDYVYNAHFLLHKRSFLESVADGTACTHVVLSVCAWAAKFYEDASGLAVLKDQGFMLEWAQRAGKLVFEDVEELVPENIVTFLNLALFWHSIGSYTKAYFLKGNAFLVQDLLGLGPKSLQTGNLLECEIRRRRFWACYVMHCHTEPGKVLQFGPKGDILTLPLPWSDRDFDAGVSQHPQISLSSEESDGSVFAVLIKATSFWSSVSSLLNGCETSLHVRVPAILALDERIQKWWKTVPSDLKLTPESVKSVPRGILTRVLHINSLYHQCLCALHASLVPLFSCNPGDGWYTVRQLSAQTAFEHACETSALVAAILETTSRTSAVPMFMGFAAYCACAIQIPFWWCSNTAVRERVQANIRANSKLLQLMTVDWKFASLMNTYIRYLYIMHSKRAIVLEDEPKNLAPDKLTFFHGDVANTRSSIFEYMAMLRNEGGGYGRPDENNYHEVSGDLPIEVSESQMAPSKPQQDSNFTQHNWDNPAVSADAQEVGQHMDAPMAEGGGMLSLLYPFNTDAFNFPLDEEMLDLPLFEIGQFDLDSFDPTPWGSNLSGRT
ncbi:hypothetical protein HD806DRAFT_541813 [Xylariaceae sp. AK1471]|nr:hypothetical protein HD806DRAFT_541813 [Xylariaceae sp. AK1471]